MLEGLPPNNAAHRLTLVTDERRARAVADLIVESFEPAEAASSAFETEDAWPGGGKAWLVEAYFGFEPDEDDIRALIAAAADEETARPRRFGLTEKRDWVANALAGLAPVRAGRFLVHGSHDRAKVGPTTSGSRSRRVSPSAPAITARRAAAFCISTGSSSAAGRARCSTSAAAPACSPSPPRRSSSARCGSATSIRSRSTVANDNARLNGVGEYCKAVVSRGVESRALARGAPYDVVFANILAKPLRLLAPVARRRDGAGRRRDRLRPASRRRRRRARRLAGAGLLLAERIDLEGWASLRLRR